MHIKVRGQCVGINSLLQSRGPRDVKSSGLRVRIFTFWAISLTNMLHFWKGIFRKFTVKIPELKTWLLNTMANTHWTLHDTRKAGTFWIMDETGDLVSMGRLRHIYMQVFLWNRFSNLDLVLSDYTRQVGQRVPAICLYLPSPGTTCVSPCLTFYMYVWVWTHILMLCDQYFTSLVVS